MTDEEQKPWVRWRSVAVCADCWTERNPDRPPVRVLAGPKEECMVCEKDTTSGIYVRMRVEWR